MSSRERILSDIYFLLSYGKHALVFLIASLSLEIQAYTQEESNFDVSIEGASPIKQEDGEYSLVLKPKECVSLYQGQSCHLTLNLSFTASVQNDYCIYIESEPSALHCWQQATKGQLIQDFETDKELVFELRKKDSESAVLSSAQLTLSWVYKASKKKRLAWRLF